MHSTKLTPSPTPNLDTTPCPSAIMSTIRSKISSALPSSRRSSPANSPRSSLDSPSSQSIASQSKSKKRDDPDKYRLLVTAGPSYDTTTHNIVHVNTSTPTYIENDFLRAKLKVRIRGYKGLPSASPSTSPYFEDPLHEKDAYSIAFSFVPKVDLPSQDVAWGNDFDHPVRDRLPPGVNTAFKIVKEFVDPGLEMDAYADEPWLFGPALSCWFGFRVGDKVEGEMSQESIPEREEADDVIHEGADGQGEEVRKKFALPDNNEKRRKHFLNRSHREAFAFEKGRLYSADFYNPYLDFGSFALKLPGFSIKVIKYIDEKSHTLRYVFKNRATGDVYLCVCLNLLWGEQLEKALKRDEDVLGKFAGKEVESTSNDDRISADQGQDMSASNGVPISDEGFDVTKQDQSAPAEPVNPKDGSKEQREADAPGMIDKPEHVRQQIEQMSIVDLLQGTASRDRRGVKGPLLDDLD